MYSLLIRGGTVIDGTGIPRQRADVALAGDRIAAVGNLADAPAARVIDAAGLIVAPGFIDTHNHSDGWLLKLGHLESKTTQGFTTEVLMSDGISYAPVTPRTAAQWLYYLRGLDGLDVADYRGWESIRDYLMLLEGRTAQNAVAQIPYANVRTLAMGWGRAVPDDTQMRIIQQEIAQAMDEGAVGLSTGLDYVAQWFATTDELVEACAPLAARHGLYVSHVRYKKGVLAGVREAVEIGRRAGVAVHISHLKTETAEAAEELIEYIDRVAVHEVDFSFDVYPYLPGSTMLHFLLPYDVWEQGPLGVAARLTCPEVRRRLAALLSHPIRTSLDKVHLAWVGGKHNSRLLGQRLSEIIAASGKPPADALADLLIDEGLAALAVFHVGDDRLAEPFVAHPRSMIGSDGIYFPDGVVHPRQYGTAPRVLGPLVRQRGLMTLETAVHKLSGWPAERFGLVDRGLLRPGAFADLAVFDPETICDRATFAQPHQLSVGMQWVLVNGVPVVADGQPLALGPEPLPGRVLAYRR